MTDQASGTERDVGEFGVADACAAELLCDRHPSDAVAFTVVESDLRCHDLTFAELAHRSARFAAALARKASPAATPSVS